MASLTAPDVMATGPAPLEAAAIEVRDLSKTFAGNRALDRVSFGFEPGLVHALLGGNGSGKSTLIKCLAGVQPGDAGGSVIAAGSRVAADRISPGWARAHGLRFVHQNASVFPHLTVQENLALGHGYPTTAGRINWRALRSHTRTLLDRFQIRARHDQVLGTLRPADQAMIAIARALQEQVDGDRNAVSTLVLDEPTASLPEEEVGVLLDAIRSYVAEGLAIVFVTHRLEEVLAIADTVTVLRDGKLVTSRPVAGLAEDDLVELIVGEALADVAGERREAHPGRVLAALRDVYAPPLRGVSLEVRAGEVLGLAGLLGSGRSEVLRVLFGDLKPASGAVVLADQPCHFGGPSNAMQDGVAYLPEDRSAAVFPNMSVLENLLAPSISRYSRRFFLHRRREREASRSLVAAFGVKAAGVEVPVSLLSGGNQQKVLLARWLHREPSLLLLDEPTQGVDVGARADAYKIIREAASRGTAVIVVSSDFEELAELSDRALVLTAGRVTSELRGTQITRHRLTEKVLMGKAQTP